MPPRAFLAFPHKFITYHTNKYSFSSHSSCLREGVGAQDRLTQLGRKKDLNLLMTGPGAQDLPPIEKNAARCGARDLILHEPNVRSSCVAVVKQAIGQRAAKV